MNEREKEKFLEFLRKEGLKMIELKRKEIYQAMRRGLKKRMRENPELRITLRSLTKMLRQDQKEC